MSKRATLDGPSLTDIPVARPSSTVVLAREAPGAPELLMVRRHEKSSFDGESRVIVEGQDVGALK